MDYVLKYFFNKIFFRFFWISCEAINKACYAGKFSKLYKILFF